MEVSGVFLRQSSRDCSFSELVYVHSRGSDKYNITYVSQTPSAVRNLTSKTESKDRREICIWQTVRHGIIKVVNLRSWWDAHAAFLTTALFEKQHSCEKYIIYNVSNEQAKHTYKCADLSLRGVAVFHYLTREPLLITCWSHNKPLSYCCWSTVSLGFSSKIIPKETYIRQQDIWGCDRSMWQLLF